MTIYTPNCCRHCTQPLLKTESLSWKSLKFYFTLNSLLVSLLAPKQKWDKRWSEWGPEVESDFKQKFLGLPTGSLLLNHTAVLTAQELNCTKPQWRKHQTCNLVSLLLFVPNLLSVPTQFLKYRSPHRKSLKWTIDSWLMSFSNSVHLTWDLRVRKLSATVQAQVTAHHFLNISSLCIL